MVTLGKFRLAATSEAHLRHQLRPHKLEPLDDVWKIEILRVPPANDVSFLDLSYEVLQQLAFSSADNDFWIDAFGEIVFLHQASKLGLDVIDITIPPNTIDGGRHYKLLVCTRP